MTKLNVYFLQCLLQELPPSELCYCILILLSTSVNMRWFSIASKVRVAIDLWRFWLRSFSMLHTIQETCILHHSRCDLYVSSQVHTFSCGGDVFFDDMCVDLTTTTSSGRSPCSQGPAHVEPLRQRGPTGHGICTYLIQPHHQCKGPPVQRWPPRFALATRNCVGHQDCVDHQDYLWADFVAIVDICWFG